MFPVVVTNCRCVVFRTVICIQKRWKNKKEHWSEIGKKKHSVDRALDHFDDFYKTVYGKKWPSIRLALLSPNKYCAVMNNFGDIEAATEELQNMGALDMKTLIDLEREHIKEKTKEEMRSRDLEKIFKLDEKLEQMMLNKQHEEITSLYPQSEDVKSNSIQTSISGIDSHDFEDEVKKPITGQNQKSLESSLLDAEVEEHRIIDPDIGLSAASLYEYVPATRLKGMEDWIGESQHYRYYKKDNDFPVHIEHDFNLQFPEYLKVLTFERGNVSPFPSPKRGSTGVLNYCLVDGGSLLPVLALDLRPGDRVLDMCAAPGTKSLIMLQTLFPEIMVCNDVQESRTNRIYSIFKQYLYNWDTWKDSLSITQKDGREIHEFDSFNKILVDVPCTTDRHSLHENDNNIFKPSRTKERLKMPETQAQLLSHALKLVRPGGTVVYSTCSLSPIQNDGVVHMALRNLWEETSIEVVVKDLTPALEPLHEMYKLASDMGLKYGHLVLPFIPCNFGPMYFCKLVRTK